jgi:hypothetical protein
MFYFILIFDGGCVSVACGRVRIMMRACVHARARARACVVCGAHVCGGSGAGGRGGGGFSGGRPQWLRSWLRQHCCSNRYIQNHLDFLEWENSVPLTRRGPWGFKGPQST